MFNPKLWQLPQISTATLNQLPDLEQQLAARLTQIAARHQAARFAYSLAVEDVLIADMIARLGLNITVFVLDTGKLHSETLTLLTMLLQHYPTLTLRCYQPQAEAAEAFEREYGMQSIYESLQQRQLCCYIRKVEPLNRALAGADAWLSGQRREQSANRRHLPLVEEDKQHGITKYNPIADWSEEAVWAYTKTHDLPFNPLYLQGYPSIGCEPCTRPIRAEEDIRAGRWWWEQKSNKECGLHQQTITIEQSLGTQ